MYKDPIVDEIHQFREQLLSKHQGDFAAYFQSLLVMQRQHPERYASFALPTTKPMTQDGSVNSKRHL